MNNQVDLLSLQTQVGECYSFFINNHKSSNLDNLEEILIKLQQTMVQLTVTNLVNIVDRVVEDGRVNNQGEHRQYNISSIQVTSDNKINLICHEVLGFDDIDKKFILDSCKSYLDFTNVIRIY